MITKKKQDMRWVLAGAALLLVTMPASAQQGASKLSHELEGGGSGGSLNVIVQYNQTPSESDHSLVTRLGGKVRRRMQALAAGGYSIAANQLSSLASNPNVTHISPDHTLRAHMDLSVAATNGSTAWKQYGVLGTGVGVAVIDSGIGPNSELAGNVVYMEDFTGGNGQDQFGHGTHVAGIIAGSGKASHCATCTRDLQGIAPGARLINLRVLDASGATTDSVLIAAIDRAIALKHVYNIRVINLSVGRPVFESYTLDPLCQAVEQAWRAGIVVVVAAGNDGRLNLASNQGYGTINSPANDPYVLTVGAMKTMNTPARTDDNIASYSSKGPTVFDGIVKPDIVAPGNMVVSTMPGNSATLTKYAATRIATSYYNPNGGSGISSTYYMLSGTSMAAALVSGAVADLLQAQPALTPDQVKTRLMTTAYKSFPHSSTAVDAVTGQTFLSYYDALTRGAGYLDLGAALATRDAAMGSAQSPALEKQFLTQNYGLALSGNSVWTINRFLVGGLNTPEKTWSTSAVSSNGTLVTNAPLANLVTARVSPVSSGLSSAWGNSSAWGTSSIWGNCSVWDSSSVSAASADLQDAN